MVCVLGLCWFSGFVAGGFGTDSVGGVFVAGDRLVVVHGLCWQLWVVVFSLRPLPFFVYIFFTLLVFLTGFLMLVFLSVVFFEALFWCFVGLVFCLFDIVFVGEFDPGSG